MLKKCRRDLYGKLLNIVLYTHRKINLGTLIVQIEVFSNIILEWLYDLRPQEHVYWVRDKVPLTQ